MKRQQSFRHLSELLSQLKESNCGAKLARFEDWAAYHDKEEVERVRRVFRTKGRVRPNNIVEIPRAR